MGSLGGEAVKDIHLDTIVLLTVFAAGLLVGLVIF
jgi:hypothetical protein